MCLRMFAPGNKTRTCPAIQIDDMFLTALCQQGLKRTAGQNIIAKKNLIISEFVS